MISISNLDIFIAKTCNLSCAGCITFSDSKLVKGITPYNSDHVEFWSNYIQPAYTNMFGGEPLINPDLEYLILLTSKKFLTDADLIPKPIPSLSLLLNPETATAIRSPSSLTIGPLDVLIRKEVFFILSNSFNFIQSLYLFPPCT